VLFYFFAAIFEQIKSKKICLKRTTSVSIMSHPKKKCNCRLVNTPTSILISSFLDPRLFPSSLCFERTLFLFSIETSMTDTINSPMENGNDIRAKDHATMQNGDTKLDEMNEKNKQQYNQRKSKTLNRESSYGEIHEQGPEAFFEADNNANENPAPIPHLQQVPRGDSYDESQEKEKLQNGYVGKSWQEDSRPGYSNKIYTSVMLEDSEHEGRPSVYLFIFVNPLSGDQKGQELTKMAIQSFRLKQAPEVQVQIYNILDDKDRELGFEMLKLVEGMAERDELMPVPENSKIGTTARRRQIHVWSAGGDGTVMSVFEELVSHKVNLDIVYFSCKQLTNVNVIFIFLMTGCVT
jgi:hypothetical protein